MFYKSENSSEEKPLALQDDKYCKFLRKDFKFIEAVKSEDEENSEGGMNGGNQDRPAHWEYLEAKVANEDWDAFLSTEEAKEFAKEL